MQGVCVLEVLFLDCFIHHRFDFVQFGFEFFNRRQCRPEFLQFVKFSLMFCSLVKLFLCYSFIDALRHFRNGTFKICPRLKSARSAILFRIVSFGSHRLFESIISFVKSSLSRCCPGKVSPSSCVGDFLLG